MRWHGYHGHHSTIFDFAYLCGFVAAGAFTFAWMIRERVIEYRRRNRPPERYRIKRPRSKNKP